MKINNKNLNVIPKSVSKSLKIRLFMVYNKQSVFSHVMSYKILIMEMVSSDAVKLLKAFVD